MAKALFYQWDGLTPISAGAWLTSLQEFPEISDRYKQLQHKVKFGVKKDLRRAASAIPG